MLGTVKPGKMTAIYQRQQSTKVESDERKSQSTLGGANRDVNLFLFLFVHLFYSR